MFHAFIMAMDTYALGLINAAKIIEDGRLDAFIKEKYQSFESEIGQKILKNQTSLEELAAYAETLGSTNEPKSGRQEYLNSIINAILFG